MFPVIIEGTVIHGKNRGRSSLGIPTGMQFKLIMTIFYV